MRGVLAAAAAIFAAGSAHAGNRDPVVSRARAKCLLAAVKLTPEGGVRDPGGTVACLTSRLAALDAAEAAAKATPGASASASVIKASAQLDQCSRRIAIDRVAMDDPAAGDGGAEEGTDPDAAYLAELQKRLKPIGTKVAKCTGMLRRSGPAIPGEPQVDLAGRVAIEVAVDKFGRAESVLLVESDGIDGFVVGCAIEALCALQAPPPPRGGFALELPFTFVEPK